MPGPPRSGPTSHLMSSNFRVLICGDRNWSDVNLILSGIRRVQKWREIDVIIHGGARGADSIAGQVAESLNIPTEVYQPDWDTHGKRAGILRNQEMLDEGKPDLILAFHDDLEHSKGTGHMVKIARQIPVPVAHITH